MMTECLVSIFNLLFSTENQLLTMFLSGFLSSTVLPGNSEIIFTTLVSKNMMKESSFYSYPLWELVAVATLANGLGSLVTYVMGIFFPYPKNLSHRYAQWALDKSEKYGVWVLLLSWLPIVGDIFCAIAGWMRFNLWQSVIFIMVGKFLRYLFLLSTLYPMLQ